MAHHKHNQQKGFAAVALMILLVVLVIGIAGYFYINKQSGPKHTQNTSSEAHDCQDPPKFTHHFTDSDQITSIIPPVFQNRHGTMPTMLININGKVPLYMPTDGKVTEGSYYLEEGTEFYMWDVDVGCGVTIVFDHITEPIDEIKRLFPESPNNHSRTEPFEKDLQMQAGELVGHTTGSTNAHNWNFAVYSNSEKNYLWETGEFIDKPKYYTQVCPFDYYEASVAKVYEKLFVSSFNDITVEENLCKNNSH